MALKNGDEAPDFTLTSNKMEPVSLNSYKGRNVVLLFYPFAFSPVCTNECKTMTADHSKFTRLNAQVLGISIDSTWTQKAFAEAYNVSYPLLSDFNKEVTRSYGVIYEDLGGNKGVAKRSAFILDKDGVVRYAWVSEDPKVEPNYSEIEGVLKELE